MAGRLSRRHKSPSAGAQKWSIEIAPLARDLAEEKPVAKVPTSRFLY
jgi:hypothetical protein